MEVCTHRTIVTSQMNHHIIWIGWQQGCKHVSRMGLFEFIPQVFFPCYIVIKPLFSLLSEAYWLTSFWSYVSPSQCWMLIMDHKRDWVLDSKLPIQVPCQTAGLPFPFDAIFPNFMVCTETFMYFPALKGFQTYTVQLRCHHMLFRSLARSNFLITDFIL